VPLPGVPRAGDVSGSARRVAPPAVGTVALACGHCGLPFKSALLGPGRRLWWRREGATILVVGFESARFWCRGCKRETLVGDGNCHNPPSVLG
jgi:hypothetical protein